MGLRHNTSCLEGLWCGLYLYPVLYIHWMSDVFNWTTLRWDTPFVCYCTLLIQILSLGHRWIYIDVFDWMTLSVCDSSFLTLEMANCTNAAQKPQLGHGFEGKGFSKFKLGGGQSKLWGKVKRWLQGGEYNWKMLWLNSQVMREETGQDRKCSSALALALAFDGWVGWVMPGLQLWTAKDNNFDIDWCWISSEIWLQIQILWVKKCPKTLFFCFFAQHFGVANFSAMMNGIFCVSKCVVD